MADDENVHRITALLEPTTYQKVVMEVARRKALRQKNASISGLVTEALEQHFNSAADEATA